jgi:hypothetical protein
VTAFAALVAAAMTCAAPAWAQRDVPQNFFGVNFDTDIAQRAPERIQDDEFDLQARSGVETSRVVFSWKRLQPNSDSNPHWSETDPVVTFAARHGIDLLPVVLEAPRWARENPNAYASPPKDARDFAAFMKLLVARYGENGTFWPENPTVPRRPLRTWQIWNEPHLRFQWDSDAPWARNYGTTLRWAYKAIKKADPGATVVLAAMSNTSWQFLAEAYKKGRIRGYFNVAALHPYTSKASGVVTLARRFRTIMRRNGDTKKPLWITELGLPASKGKDKSKNALQTTDEGMADFLTTAMEKLVAGQTSRNIRVARVYWYTWASVYCCGDIFRYTGLRIYDPRDQTLENKPAYSAYLDSARRHQACVKNGAGVCQ